MAKRPTKEDTKFAVKVAMVAFFIGKLNIVRTKKYSTTKPNVIAHQEKSLVSK